MPVLFQSLQKLCICLISVIFIFFFIMSCFYQSVFNGQFLWYFGNTDEKLHNIFKASQKSTKILCGDPWDPFSIVLKWVLTVYSNELHNLTNIDHQFKKRPHLPKNERFHYLEKKLLATDHNFFKVILHLHVHSNNKYITVLSVENS